MTSSPSLQFFKLSLSSLSLSAFLSKVASEAFFSCKCSYFYFRFIAAIVSILYTVLSDFLLELRLQTELGLLLSFGKSTTVKNPQRGGGNTFLPTAPPSDNIYMPESGPCRVHIVGVLMVALYHSLSLSLFSNLSPARLLITQHCRCCRFVWLIDCAIA